LRGKYIHSQGYEYYLTRLVFIIIRVSCLRIFFGSNTGKSMQFSTEQIYVMLG